MNAARPRYDGPMRIVIIGAGGVGGLLAGLLSQAGEEVAVLARGAHLAAIRERGLRVEGDMGSFTAKVEATDSIEALAPADAVFVATKAWQVAEVAPRLPGLVREGTVVVPLQNGVDAALTLFGGLWPGPVLGGLCAVFSWIDGPGVIRMAGPPLWVKAGEWPRGRSARVEALCEVLRRAGVDARPQEDVEAAAWEKFLFIDPFGAAGALAASPIGTVRGTPETRALLEQLVREVAALGRARGVHLASEAEARTIAWFDRRGGPDGLGERGGRARAPVRARRPLAARDGGAGEEGAREGAELRRGEAQAFASDDTCASRRAWPRGSTPTPAVGGGSTSSSAGSPRALACLTNS